VEDRPGGGASFKVFLPEQSPAPDLVKRSVVRAPAPPGTGLEDPELPLAASL
jgi:hypothetical protein